MPKLISTNPSDGYAVLGEVSTSSAADVRRAVERARGSFVDWGRAPLGDRISAVRSFAEQAAARRDRVAQLIALETGRPIATLDGHIDATFDFLHAYCEMADEHLGPVVTATRPGERHVVIRQPYGVAAAICPWNYPLLNVAWQCGQALIAGNTLVYKNSEENPLFAALLQEMFAASEVPDGVFNVLQGDGAVGHMMVESDIDMVSFTGSSATGKAIAVNLAGRLVPFMAELGGSSPGIIFEDIQVDDYLDEVFWRRFFHSGQTCDSLKRLIVHESKFDTVVDGLRSIAESCAVGPAIDRDTRLGPLVSEGQLRRITAQVESSVRAGAQVAAKGKVSSDLRGAYYAPTILTGVTADMAVWREETFGPVLPVVAFRSEEEAVRLANDTNYGLTAFIMTEDVERFHRVARAVQAGSIVHNHGSYDHPSSPFGGWKDSGLGRTHGAWGFHEVTQPKLLSIQDKEVRTAVGR